MTDNLTIQKFSSFFTYIIYDIMQILCDFPSASLYLILGISFVLHIFSLKSLFNNRAKNEMILKIIHTLHTDNDQLKNSTLYKRIQPI